VTVSKSSRKLESFREVTRRRIKTPASTPWTWKDHAFLWGAVSGLMLLVFLPFLDQYIQGRHQIASRMNAWREQYPLSAAKMDKIEELEREYHGLGRQILGRRQTPEDAARHRQAIAAQLEPDDARMFLEKDFENHK
jgi:hypothetical protein